MVHLLRLLAAGLLFPAVAIAASPTARYVDSKDPTCGGRQPCYATIQTAVNAAGAGDTVQIQAGRYREQISVEGKNSSDAASEADRIIIEADPLSPVGSVVLVGAVSRCSDGHALRVQRSNFVTIRGMTITGARGAAVLLLGGAEQNYAVHIERNRIVHNGRDQCNTGIMVGSGNSATVIVNNLIYGNAGDGIRFDGASEGPHYVVNNTIHRNDGSGIRVSVQEHVLLVNNALTFNAGSGVRRDPTTLSDPGRIQLLHNLLCGNHVREIERPVMDGADTWNLTPTGREGSGAMATPDCAGSHTIYAHWAGSDGQLNTEDDDFTLATGSPAIGQGLDPRTLGLDPDLDAVFEADFLSPGARVVAGGDGGFDIGAIAFETPGPSDQPPQVTIVTPQSAAFIRGSVSILADAKSQRRLAKVTLRAGSRALPSTLEPTSPAPVSRATATWKTTGVPNGAHTLTATATDSAGQTTTATHLVIVDNIPPTTWMTGSPEGTITTTAATVSFGGGDDLTSPANLEFAWRLDKGPFTAFASATTASLSRLTVGHHTFTVKARDQAGNEDPTPAQWGFTVSPPAAKTYALTISLAGKGSGTVSGAGTYPAGTVVGLTATPATGSTFMGWSPTVCGAGILTMPAALVACVATFGVGTSPGPPGSGAPPVTVTLGWAGTLRDRVGQGYGVVGDGVPDGTFTMTFSGAQTVRQVVLLRSPAGSGMWDTIAGNPPWTLGVAKSLDTPLLNLANGALPSVPVTEKTVWPLFASDISPSLFTPGSVFTVTVTFSDGTTTAATATIPARSSPPPLPPGNTMSWADRIVQPGVRTAVQMSSLADIQSGGSGTTQIQHPGGIPGFIVYDAVENALRMDVPASFGTPGMAWTHSLPYAQQFDQGSEFWLQFDVKWDAGMLTPSNGGGGIKFFTVDEGILPDGFNPGSCDNGGNFPMQGQIVGTSSWAGTGRFPSLYHSCGFIMYPGNTSGVYDGLVDIAPDGDTLFQNMVAGCTYRRVTAGRDTCVRFVPDVWHTFTLRVKIGTWYKNDFVFKHDSQIDFWMSRPGLPTTYLVSKKNYDLANESPGRARYGKLWLLPYDTGRRNSSVDGKVWYRNVLIADQPLRDPVAGVPLVAGAPPSPPGGSPGSPLPAAPPPPPTGSPSTGSLSDIPDNGWAARIPNPSTRYIPGGNPGSGGAVTVPNTPSDRSTPAARYFSGLTYGGGRLAYFGGGHGGWPGNDVEIYEIAANAWTQSWKPEVCLNGDQPCGAIYGGSTSPYTTPLGRPYVEHTYQQSLWRPDLNLFEFFTRGTGPFLFNPVAKTMTRSPTAVTPQGIYYPWGVDVAKEHAFWAPGISDRLVIITAGGTGAGIWRQNRTTLQWGIVGQIPMLTQGGTFYSTYAASQRRHLMMVLNGQGMGARSGAPRTWWWFDSVALTFTQIAMPSGPDVADFVEYDSKNDRLVAIQDSVDPVKLWVGTADASTWTALRLTATPPSNARSKGLDVESVLPSWQYDPVNNVFWYLAVYFSAGTVDLWAYRYKN